MVHVIAKSIGKFEHEVLALPIDELLRHRAFLQIEKEENEKETRRWKRKHGQK